MLVATARDSADSVNLVTKNSDSQKRKDLVTKMDPKAKNAESRNISIGYDEPPKTRTKTPGIVPTRVTVTKRNNKGGPCISWRYFSAMHGGMKPWNKPPLHERRYIRTKKGTHILLRPGMKGFA